MVLALVFISLATSAVAQEREEPSRRTSFIGGASFGDGETAPALSAALHFAFSPRFGLEFELAYARKLDFTIDLCPPPRLCFIGEQFPLTGRSVSLVPHFVFELVPGSERLRAYVQAGVGAGHVRQRYFIGPVVANDAGEPLNELTRSNVVAAFSAGGGVAVRIVRWFEIGADVRSLHLLDEEATPERFITPDGLLSTLRVGSRVSWRF